MGDSIKALQKEITDFRDERNWAQFYNPKDLAISISLEAAELLEVFQWSGEDVEATDKVDKVKEELADVINYSFLLADRLNLDVDEIVRAKIAKNREKYPAELAYGNSAKYTELKEAGRQEK